MKFKNYMRLKGIVVIGNSNDIGTSLNGLFQEVNQKEKTFSVSSKHIYINKCNRTSHWVGHSKLK